jgi:hypothetical protein
MPLQRSNIHDLFPPDHLAFTLSLQRLGVRQSPGAFSAVQHKCGCLISSSAIHSSISKRLRNKAQRLARSGLLRAYPGKNVQKYFPTTTWLWRINSQLRPFTSYHCPPALFNSFISACFRSQDFFLCPTEEHPHAGGE